MKEILLRALLDVQKDVNDGDIDGSTGICQAVSDYLPRDRDGELAMRALKADMKRWPLYSGNSMFPVPDPSDPNAQRAFYAAQDDDLLWEGAYGANRKALLKWLIDQLVT